MEATVDKYLIDGCMRCKYGATPQCKVNNWKAELILLRAIVLQSNLKEEIKWGIPVYTKNGKNIVSINAFKESTVISFFKGVLLADKHKILQQQGNIQSSRIIRYTNVDDIQKTGAIISAYIAEAISLEEENKKVSITKNPEPIPNELIQAFEADEAFKSAFHALTQGRQRAYIINFSQAKQTATTISRINKYKAQILAGIGLHDEYKMNNKNKQ
jgi:uncharacterized protein YdeI (YjbR/CyaY-like superfamily)